MRMCVCGWGGMCVCVQITQPADEVIQTAAEAQHVANDERRGGERGEAVQIGQRRVTQFGQRYDRLCVCVYLSVYV